MKNHNFNYGEFATIGGQARLNSYDGTFPHPDIAVEIELTLLERAELAR